MKTARERRQSLAAGLSRLGRPQTRQEVLLEDIAHTLHDVAEMNERAAVRMEEARRDREARERFPTPWWKRLLGKS